MSALKTAAGDHAVKGKQCRRRIAAVKKQAAKEKTGHATRIKVWTGVYYVLGVSILALSALGGTTAVVGDNPKLAGWSAFGAALLTTLFGIVRPQHHVAHQRRLVLAYETVLERCSRQLREETDARVCAAASALEDQFEHIARVEIRDEDPLPDLPV